MKILLGLSGGVDSTYAAKALLAEGHEVEAAVLIMHDAMNISEAEESARSLGIKLNVIDCRDAFDKCVKSNFVSEYINARTPNPCVVCNSEVKFVYLHKFARENGFDKIATGHYAGIKRLSCDGVEHFGITRGADIKKDQTYMLWRIPQYILEDTVFPLEKMMKSEIREDCKASGLAAADRKDSQEICFLPGGNYAEYVESVAGESKHGDFVDENGNKLGEHKGIIRYTVGQRRGLGVSAASRLFVTEIDPVSNTVTLSPNDSFANRVNVKGLVYSGMQKPGNGDERILFVKLRYASAPTKAKVVFFEDRAEILLETPQRAVTPGQSAVFYDGDLLVAGGFIENAYSE